MKKGEVNLLVIIFSILILIILVIIIYFIWFYKPKIADEKNISRDPFCGDGLCNNWEDDLSCPVDCKNGCVLIDNSLNLNIGFYNNQCAPNLNVKPKYCNNGTIIDNCKECGCLPYQFCKNNGECTKQCADGTIDEMCSNKKPLVCVNWDLFNDCNKCGCKTGEICQESGYCVNGETEINLIQLNIEPILVESVPSELRVEFEKGEFKEVKLVFYTEKLSFEVSLDFLESDGVKFIYSKNWAPESISEGGNFSVDLIAKNFENRTFTFTNVGFTKILSNSKFKCEKLFGAKNSKINIIFVADEINNKSRFIEYIAQVVGWNGEDGGLFSLNPFNSNKDNFGVYSLYSEYKFYCIPYLARADWPYSLEDNRLECREDFIRNLTESICKEKFQQIDVVSGVAGFATRAHASVYDDFATSSISYPPSEFVHEFGHSFGNLGDEYFEKIDKSYMPTSDLNAMNINTEGCPAWCSGALNKDAECYNYYLSWKNCTEGLPGYGTPTINSEIVIQENENIEGEWESCWDEADNKLFNEKQMHLYECNLGINCQIGTGCFFTAHGINGWRQMNNTIMSYASNLPYTFGPVSEESIQEIINTFL